jgi:hypothetical protein
MPISPSNLPWWGWLLCSLGAWIIGAVAIGMSDQKEERTGCLLGLIGGIAALIGFLTTAMAVILFVRWVWNS